jgi:twitching motility protein PilT
MLVTMGGSRYVEQLSERPVQWTTRLDGVGVIAVAAIMRKDVVQARFTVARRDTGAGVSKAPPAPKDPVVVPAIAQQSRPAELRRTQQGTGGPQPTPAGVPAPAAQAPPPVPKPAAAGGGSPSAAAQPAAAPAGAGGGGSQSSAVQRAAAPQPQPQAASVKAAVAAPAHVASVPPAAGPLAGAVPPPDDWDDDDEPTVQTLSPPVAPPQLQQQQQAALAHAQTLQVPPGEEPKPKPARKPGEVAGQPAPAADDRKAADERRAIEERAAAEKKAAEERAAAEKRAADERSAAERKAAEERAASEKKAADERKAAEERAAAEKKAADERKAAEERAAHERKIIEERAAAERKAADDRKVAEERKLAEQRNAQERVNQERIVAERAAAEKRAAIERAAAERQVAAERLAAERKAAERAKVERRISTPTSVDAVDVEITTADSGSGTRPVAGDSAEVEVEIVDNTVELSPVDVAVARVATAAMPAHGVASAIPSTTPSAALLPEKDRPRADGALESFLALAVAARASDVHVVAGRPVLLRVATDLLPRTQPVLPEHVESIAREIVPGRLREALETDGSCDFAIDHPAHGRFRVNVSRQRTGYKLSMRVIPREIPTLAALALPDAVGAAAKYAQGLVLVTGPTGHGKTSTLAAIVDILNRDSSRHVLTIEDPVEFVHPRKRAMISQREVGTHARSFASALKASLREDPDVIVVGELRDPETVRMAIAASESGHLVIGSMNTPTAAKTIDRLIDMFPAAEQAQIRASVASVLRLVIGQRLVPSADRTRLHAAVEMLPSSIALYALIRDARTFQIPSLQQRGRTLGVIRLDESLAELVRSQKVTLEVAKQFAESPQELEAYSTRNISAAVARKG